MFGRRAPEIKASAPPSKTPAPPKRPRRSGLSGLSAFLSFVLIGAIIAIGAFGYVLVAERKAGPLTADKVVAITREDDGGPIADQLERAGVIDSATMFSAMTLFDGAHGALKRGEYAFKAGVSLREVEQQLIGGKVVLHSITLPEGLTSEQIVQRLRDDDVLTGEVKEPPREGSLLPETYKFARGETRQALLGVIERAQTKAVDEIWKKRAPDLPIKSPGELVTLASIVEKETGKADERARVAGVFINRLNKHMRLESDPTIVYGLVFGKGTLGHAITKAELDEVTPYNTYHIEGLPPGPICNPGKAAMEAVANPARSREFYFVADGTGGHAFAETLDQHKKNVEHWRQIEKDAKDRLTPEAAPPGAPGPARRGDIDTVDPNAFGDVAPGDDRVPSELAFAAAEADPSGNAPEPAAAGSGEPRDAKSAIAAKVADSRDPGSAQAPAANSPGDPKSPFAVTAADQDDPKSPFSAKADESSDRRSPFAAKPAEKRDAKPALAAAGDGHDPKPASSEDSRDAKPVLAATSRELRDAKSVLEATNEELRDAKSVLAETSRQLLDAKSILAATAKELREAKSAPAETRASKAALAAAAVEPREIKTEAPAKALEQLEAKPEAAVKAVEQPAAKAEPPAKAAEPREAKPVKAVEPREVKPELTAKAVEPAEVRLEPPAKAAEPREAKPAKASEPREVKPELTAKAEEPADARPVPPAKPAELRDPKATLAAKPAEARDAKPAPAAKPAEPRDPKPDLAAKADGPRALQPSAFGALASVTPAPVPAGSAAALAGKLARLANSEQTRAALMGDGGALSPARIAAGKSLADIGVIVTGVNDTPEVVSFGGGDDGPAPSGPVASVPMSAAAYADYKARAALYGSAPAGILRAPVAALAGPAPSAAPAPRARAFDASEGTRLDPLLNKTYDLSYAKVVPDDVK